MGQEPVKLDTIDAKRIVELLKNHSDKLRLINVWATWCVPCVEEFPDFVTMNRMYRDRGFEFVSISADEPENKDKALKFLQRKEASGPNYIFTGDSKYKLIEAVDPKWAGALPYTILVEPNGKVVYAHEGIIDPDALKLIIFNDPMIGRVYKQ
jgi:thiol-disulfide isomerase/thioredoxin